MYTMYVSKATLIITVCYSNNLRVDFMHVRVNPPNPDPHRKRHWVHTEGLAVKHRPELQNNVTGASSCGHGNLGS